MRRMALVAAAGLLAYAVFTVAMLTPEARSTYWAMFCRRPRA